MRIPASKTGRGATVIAARLCLLSIASVLAFGGFGCKGTTKEVAELIKPFELKVWRVFDGTDSFSQIIDGYRLLNPHVNVTYRKLSFDEYEDELLNAIAEGRGPDILSLHNTWLAAWQPRIMAAPPVVKMPLREIKGSIKKEVVYTAIEKPGPSLESVKNDFVDGVYDDVVLLTPQSDPRLPPVPQVYGLPMASDSLVVYYNRDLLANAGIAQPATDWKTFQEQVKQLTRLDETGAIIQSGAALGGSANVERASDILSLLMMQNGTRMTDPNTRQATFDKTPPEMTGRASPPGVEALLFYADFANPEKEVYTWNDLMPDSLDAFANGQTAYFFGYSYHLPVIRNFNKQLNFGISPFPQIQGNSPTNFANYWVETVSKMTEHPNEAWDFLMYATRAENVQSYLRQTRKPTALRALVNSQLEDLDLSVFAAQAPTAKNWYHGTNAQATEKAYLDMIRQTVSREADPKRIVELAATKVNQTIK
jgi:multiple sugar transport system substrate-binding protein